MSKIKYIFTQALMISTGILFVIGLGMMINHLCGEEQSLSWYMPFSIILAGFVTALPTFLLEGYENWSRKKFISRVVMHCLLIYGIIAALGRLFEWYTTISGYISVSVGFVIVYVLAWAWSIWMAKKDEKEINDALTQIRDDE